MTTTSATSTMKKLWNADFGFWNVPLAAGFAFALGTLMTYFVFRPLHSSNTSYVAIDVGWAQAARCGLLLAGLAAAVTLYPELRKVARRP
jgi:hypothetical protein